MHKCVAVLSAIAEFLKFSYGSETGQTHSRIEPAVILRYCFH